MDRKLVDLTQRSLPELYELKDRQLLILSNKSILENLTDKGKQIQEFLDKVVGEIEAREAMNAVEKEMQQLELKEGESKCDYSQRICGIEKVPSNESFKPFKSYVQEEKKVVLKAPVRPVRRIALRESLEIQKLQVSRSQLDHLRMKFREVANEIASESEMSCEEDGSNDENNDPNTTSDQE